MQLQCVSLPILEIFGGLLVFTQYRPQKFVGLVVPHTVYRVATRHPYSWSGHSRLGLNRHEQNKRCQGVDISSASRSRPLTCMSGLMIQTRGLWSSNRICWNALTSNAESVAGNWRFRS